MNLSELKTSLKGQKELQFLLPNGLAIAPHFHLTEVALQEKKYIDCGGTFRAEQWISLQLWHDNDTDHRLSADKFQHILELAEKELSLENLNIVVEYQGETIGSYDLTNSAFGFVLQAKQTNCLAPDKCGIPAQKPKIALGDLTNNASACCGPNQSCC